MSQRPWPIVLIAIFHILAPIFNLVMSARLIDASIANYIQIQLRQGILTFSIWMLLPVLAGTALLTFRKWSYFLFLGFMAGMMAFTWRQRLYYPHRVDLWTFALSEIFNLLMILYFLSPTVKEIYLNKRIRWWQQKPRYLLTSPGRVMIPSGSPAPFQLENFSEGGALITSPIQLELKKSYPMEFDILGEKVTVSGKPIHSHDNYYGVLFDETLANRQVLRPMIQKLKKSRVPRRGQQLSLFASLWVWARDLLKSGHGIFPDIPSAKKESSVLRGQKS